MSAADLFRLLTTERPDVASNAAAAILAEHYALHGDLEPLESERDRNFLVSTDHGRYVLKIASSAEHPDVTEFQTQALLHIERSAPALPVPRVMRASNGDVAVPYRASDGRWHRVRLLSFLDGQPIKRAERRSETATTLGTRLAELGRALADFDHPASGYALLWDLKRAASLRELLDCVDDADLRALCQRRLDVFDADVEPAFDSLRWQVIHNDLNPGNVLFDAENTSRVTGIIDFGDIVRSPLIVDVAVACAYLLCRNDDPFTDAYRFVSAYNSVTALAPDEIEQLFDLTLTRSTMTILISHWRAARYPENRDYILRSAPVARELLARSNECRRADIKRQFMRVCNPG